MKRFAVITVFILFAARAAAETLITFGDSAAPGEKHAAYELAKDIEHACGAKPEVSQHSAASDGDYEHLILVGTRDTHDGIRRPAEAGNISVSAADPGPEAFIIKSLDNRATLVIAGGDERGTLYGAYEFSRRFLGIDPYEYWTGRRPPPCDKFEIPSADIREKPPAFPLRGYFDNDNDMIANWKDPKLIIEFETWKEMIDSLARLRYNYIDLHDTLGRAEFWNWPYYTGKFDYHADVELIDRIIDYTHSKGLMAQIPMYLGWEFHHLPEDKFCLSKHHDDWMEVYRYYLEESPIGKADLFLQRPRDPWWDRAYRCPEEEAAGILPGPLMTRMFNGLLELVNKHRPGGKVVCDLWAEGREMWRANNFDPDTAIDMLWADGGYANYGTWPEDFKGHNFGVYIHAGYYLNHVMQDPYPARIKEATMEAVRRGMTHNYFVNGQDFKHFILNLEACARAAWDPEGFDPEAFYLEWTTRYFGGKAAPDIVESLKALHRASSTLAGFTKVMDMTDELVSRMVYLGSIKVDVEPARRAMVAATESLNLAEKAAAAVPPEAELVYDDQILFPARIYLENLKLYMLTAKTMNAFHDRRDKSLPKEQRKEAKANLKAWKKQMLAQLKKLRALLEQGSKWKKWEGWTHPDNFRKITPPPDVDRVERMIRSLN